MLLPPSFAEVQDSVTSSETVLICAGILLVAAILAFIPVRLAMGRPQRGLVSLAAMLWALTSAGSAARTSIAELKWSRQYMTDISTGYLDPRDQSGAPTVPWILFILLAVSYAALLFWAARRSRDNKAAS